MSHTSPTNRIVRPGETAVLLGISRATLWRYSAKPGFPKKVRLYGCVGWFESELQDWARSHQENR